MHGTHVAGTVAGSTYGVAKAATVIAVRVANDQGVMSTVNLLGARDWIANQRLSTYDQECIHRGVIFPLNRNTASKRMTP